MVERSIILDTDIGYDPDDLFALALLNKLAPHDLRLVVTANECNEKRLSFLSQALHLMDNYTTNIVIGSLLGRDKFTVDKLLTDEILVNLNQRPFTEQMASVVRTSKETIYIGIGGFTDLAKFIELYPVEAKQMKIFMMGGSLCYERYPGWMEYNIKLDPSAADKVIEADLDIHLVMAQTTNHSGYEINPDSSILKKLKFSDSRINELIVKHCELWFKKRNFQHGTSMHDPLTVATALGHDFVTLETVWVTVNQGSFDIAQMAGHAIKLARPISRVDDFMRFLEVKLLS